MVYCIRGGSVSNSVVDKLLAAGVSARYIEGGWEVWKILRPPEDVGDVYAKVAKFGEETPEGKLERFLLSWKDRNMDRMMKYTTTSDQAQVADNAPADARKPL